MELKEFISNTLIQIVDGVKEAKEKCEVGNNINPKISRIGGDISKRSTRTDDFKVVQHVSFDVALTVEETEGSKEGVGVFIAAIGLGKENAESTQSSSVSRIKFEVPITLP
jgi:hypothetical protein